MATLSELLEVQGQIESLLYENGGELTPEIEEAIGLNEENITAKIDGYHSLISKMDFGSAEIDAEIKRLQALKKTKQNSQKRLKEYLLIKMQEFGRQSIEGTTCKVFRKATPESVEIEDEVSLLSPYGFELEEASKAWPEWVKVSLEIDRTKLKAVLKTGEVNGCSLTRGECVQFR